MKQTGRLSLFLFVAAQYLMKWAEREENRALEVSHKTHTHIQVPTM